MKELQQKERYLSQTDDGWEIPIWRYPAPEKSKGLPAMLIHGYPGDHRSFDSASGKPGLAPFLRDQGREVWVVEYRTMGESKCREGKADHEWRIEDYLKDVCVAIEKMNTVLGSQRFHVAGHSFGGFLVHHLLLTHFIGQLASAATLAAPSFAALPLGRIEPYAPFILRSFGSLPVGALRNLLIPPLMGLSFLSRFRPGLHVLGMPPHVAGYLLDKTISKAVTGIMKQYAGWIKDGEASTKYGHLEQSLPQISLPFLGVSGVRDPMGEKAFRHIVETIGSRDKRFVLAGKKTGFSRNYGHVNLVLGATARLEIYPILGEWMQQYDK